MSYRIVKSTSASILQTLVAMERAMHANLDVVPLMKDKKDPKIEVGMMFRIPIDQDRFSIGEIVSVPHKDFFILRVFRSSFEELPSSIDEDVLLLGATLDAKIVVGDWQPLEKIPVRSSGSISKNAERRSHAVRNLMEFMMYATDRSVSELTIVAPVRFELALKAYHGSAPWKPEYDTILF